MYQTHEEMIAAKRARAEREELEWQREEAERASARAEREARALECSLRAIRAERDDTIASLNEECETLGEDLKDLRAGVVSRDRFLEQRGLLHEFHQWAANGGR